jgi:hypothetical protein
MRITNALLILGTLGLAAACSGTSGPSDGSSPQVQITAPLNQATVGGQVSFDADVTDNFGVDLVRFYVDGTLVSTQYSPPFHYVWNTAAVPDQSTHILKVDAMDVAKNLGLMSITVTVSRGTSSPIP